MYDFGYMWNLEKQNKQTEQKENSLIETREERDGCQRGSGWGDE